MSQVFIHRQEGEPMSVGRGLFVRKDSTRGTTPVEARVALAGLLTQSGDLGVTPGVLSGGVVSGRSTAPTWAYSVGAGHYVTTRSATDGAVLMATDGPTDTPTVSAAPATGSRWDLIWIRHRDVENADPDSNAVLGVTSGASGGSPSKPYGSVPVGALVLAEAQVSAGASNTADPLVTITPVAPRVAARGGIIPVTSTTQRDLLSAVGSPANPIYTDLGGTIYRSTGSGWKGSTAIQVEVEGAAIVGTYTGQPILQRYVNRTFSPDSNGDVILMAAAAYSGGGILGVDVQPSGVLDLVFARRMLSGNLVCRAYNTAGTVVTSAYPASAVITYWKG
jgi:hypothetical protein